MDKQKVLEYLKQQSRPEALGDIAKALGLDHAEAARHLQALSRENQAFRSVKDGHAYYSANPADGEGAIPTQAFIDGIQKGMQAALGGAGVTAQTAQGGGATDVLLSLMNNASDQDAELPAESPVNWTYDGGLKFENERFSVPIPDGFRIVTCAERAFAAVPEASGITDGADADNLSQAEVQILDGKMLGGAIEDPVLADSEIYPVLIENMGYKQANGMRQMEKGPLAALTNDVQMKTKDNCLVVSVQTGTGYSHMVETMTCDGIKMLRVQTSHTPRAKVEQELEALLNWIAKLEWKREMPRRPLDDPALTKDVFAWLKAVQKRTVQLANYRSMAVDNEVNRRDRNLSGADEFKALVHEVIKAAEPVFVRFFSEITAALSGIEAPDLNKVREVVDQAKGFYPVNVGADGIDSFTVEGSDEIKKRMAAMNDALAQKERAIREKEEAERRAEEQRKAEERARREAEERKKKEALRQAAEADAKRRSALEDADRAQYDAFMAQYNQTRQACEEEKKALSQRLENRRQELAGLGLFKFSAKKEARADIERMEAEQRALPGQQKEKLAGLWKALTADQIQTILRHLAMQVLAGRDNSQREDVQKFAESSLQDFQITFNQIANAIEQLKKRGQIVELANAGAPKLRAVKAGETAESILEAERRRVEEERKREEARKAEEQRQRKEDAALIADIMNVLVDGESHSISEIMSGVNSFRRQFKGKECSFADVQRALGWMKQDGQVKFGRAPYATRNKVGYYMA